MTSYGPPLFVLGVASFVLFVLDRRMALAFLRHEKREQQMYNEIALTADGAAGKTRELTREMSVVQAEHALIKISVENVNELVKAHDKRISMVEERVMRASMQVPHAHRRKGDE